MTWQCPAPAGALPHGCPWPSSTGAAVGASLLHCLQLSSTWGSVGRPKCTNLVTLPLLHSQHLQWHRLHCYSQIPSLHPCTAFLPCISILCNWPCQKSPYITTATPGTCLTTHACLPSLSTVIFCTWMDSALIQELLKIKKPRWQTSGTHRAWHNSFLCLSQTASVHWNIKTWAQHMPVGKE